MADERRRDLYHAMMSLTPEQRRVVGCRFFFNLSVREVAAMMGKSEGAVKALQFRALERLRRQLAAEWAQVLAHAGPRRRLPILGGIGARRVHSRRVGSGVVAASGACPA